MPINPLIPLSSQRPDIGGRVLDLRAQKRQEQRQNELLELQKNRDTREQQAFETAQQRELDDREFESMVVGATQLRPLLDNEDLGSARQFLANRTKEIVARGGNPQDTLEIAGLLNAGEIDRAKDLVDTAIRAGQVRGVGNVTSANRLPASIQEFQFFQSLSPDEKEQFLNVQRGNRPFEVDIGGAPALVTPSQTGGNPQTQMLSTPEVERQAEVNLKTATEQALLDVRRQAELAEKAEDSNTAFSTYTAARDRLVEALDNTLTGPLVGRAPAVTAAQQIAEGTRAAMAPVLKSLFRVSGEGVFTDRDQQLLLDMLPDRTDLPEAQKAKMAAVDAIVMAKLNQAQSQESVGGEAPEGTVIMNAEGKRLIKRSGQWVPL